jgi:hypothetical protein
MEKVWLTAEQLLKRGGPYTPSEFVILNPPKPKTPRLTSPEIEAADLVVAKAQAELDKVSVALGRASMDYRNAVRSKRVRLEQRYNDLCALRDEAHARVMAATTARNVAWAKADRAQRARDAEETKVAQEKSIEERERVTRRRREQLLAEVLS